MGQGLRIPLWNCQIINFCHVEIFRQTPSAIGPPPPPPSPGKMFWICAWSNPALGYICVCVCVAARGDLDPHHLLLRQDRAVYPCHRPTHLHIFHSTSCILGSEQVHIYLKESVSIHTVFMLNIEGNLLKHTEKAKRGKFCVDSPKSSVCHLSCKMQTFRILFKQQSHISE